MADRNDGRAGKLRAQHLVERGFGGLVERGGRFVEEQEIRLLQDGARDREPLLFAERQNAVPVRLFVQPRCKRGQAHGLERARQRVVRERARLAPDR